MKLNLVGKEVISWVKRAETTVRTALDIMSIAAIALFVWSQVVSGDWTVPIIKVAWSSLQVTVRTAIWLSFVASVATYAAVAALDTVHLCHKERALLLMRYARAHTSDLVVCLCWIPQWEMGKFDSYIKVLSLTNLVPLDVMQLAGTLAHAWKVVRFISRRFSQHPLFVTSTAMAVQVGAASSLLVHFEPTTYATFWEAAWYSLATIAKVGGSGDVSPHTAAGRAVSLFLTLGSWSFAGVFIGLVSGLVKKEILAPDADSMSDVKKELAEQKAMLEELLRRAGEKKNSD